MSIAPGLPLLLPGTVPPWRAAAARAAAVAAVAVACGVVMQWPMLGHRDSLLAANLVVSGAFAAGSILLSDQPDHARTRRALLVASVLWSVAWINVWKFGPLPFIASLIGPAPATVAIWGLLQFPRPWHRRGAAAAVVVLIVIMQAASAAMTLTEDHPSGSWWPRVSAPQAHVALLALYNDGGVVCAVLLAGLFAARTMRLRGHELKITVPIGVAVVAGGLATALGDSAAAAGDSGGSLWALYAWEDVLLVCVPASFILSFVLRRLCIEELSGRIDPYDTVPEACRKLRQALRDPTLQILLPAAGAGPLADADGCPRPAPAEDGRRLLLPVTDENGREVAVISTDPSLSRFDHLLTATAQALVLVLDNARLLSQMRDEVALAQQSRDRVDAAIDAERRQIRHRTHAGTVALADAARDHLENAAAALSHSGQPAPGELSAARAAIVQATADLLLLSSGAEPLGLGNGLADAIPRALSVHPSVSAQVTGARADPEVEQVAYFVVTAAVGNAIRHAGPDATISVTVAATERRPAAQADDQPGAPGGFLVIDIRDNGRGGADPGGHGLTLMAARTAIAGGDLHIASPVGQGTTIRAIFPRRR
jgi:signal transduction histidine kinase